MKSGERDLGIRTKLFARQVIRMYCELSKETVAQVLGKQTLRSGTAVGANYREAYRARSRAEFIAKIGDCLKEADETVYWLELLAEERVVQPEKIYGVLGEAQELVAILTTIHKNTRNSPPTS